MSLTHNSVHEFALYYPQLEDRNIGDQLEITDKQLCSRMTSVLRVKLDEVVILFNRLHHARMVVESVSKKSITLRVLEFQANKQLAPSVTIAVGLLKRDALDQAVYSLTELGVNHIQLLMTEKVQRKWGGEKERERLERIIAAAAEQSKNYAMPELHDPVPLADWLNAQTQIYWCDVAGAPLYQVLSPEVVQQSSTITALVGPEGDLSPSEKELVSPLADAVLLTPTVLRSVQAVTVLAGYVRCLC